MLFTTSLSFGSIASQECRFGDSQYDTCCQDPIGGKMSIDLSCTTPAKMEELLANVEKRGKVHAEPLTYGSYTVAVSHDSVESMLVDYRCYLGQTGYPDPLQLNLQPNFEHLINRSYYWNHGDPPATLNSLTNSNQPALPWLADPTNGVQKYQWGCAYSPDLITHRSDGKPGFSLNAMVKPSPPPRFAWPTGDLYTLRLHSKDQFNGGLIVISVSKLPYGAALWPAFWMLGQNPASWTTSPPKTPGLALRNTWPYRGEIDIIEYASAYTKQSLERNHLTLHTNPNCYSKRSSPNGQAYVNVGQRDGENVALTNQGGSDCNYDQAKYGCAAFMKPNSVGGPYMEARGGAIYAIEWVKGKHIKAWHWFKDTPHPDFTRTNLTTEYIETFGLADVMHYFEFTCDIDNMLSDMMLVFNTAVCGDWGAGVDSFKLDGDVNGVDYATGSANCETAIKQKMNNKSFIDERLRWDVDFVKVFT